MAKSNVKKYYIAALNDVPCGHAHRSFPQAEECVKQTIRAAKRGEKFHSSDYAKSCRVEDAAIWVKSQLVAR